MVYKIVLEEIDVDAITLKFLGCYDGINFTFYFKQVYRKNKSYIKMIYAPSK